MQISDKLSHSQSYEHWNAEVMGMCFSDRYKTCLRIRSTQTLD